MSLFGVFAQCMSPEVAHRVIFHKMATIQKNDYLSERTVHVRGCAILSARIAANDGKHLARDVAGTAWCGEEDKGRRDFLRLCGPLHRRIAAEFGDALFILVGGIEGGPRCKAY
jgi:hypothetical protein